MQEKDKGEKTDPAPSVEDGKHAAGVGSRIGSADPSLFPDGIGGKCFHMPVKEKRIDGTQMPSVVKIVMVVLHIDIIRTGRASRRSPRAGDIGVPIPVIKEGNFGGRMPHLRRFCAPVVRRRFQFEVDVRDIAAVAHNLVKELIDICCPFSVRAHENRRTVPWIRPS